MLLLGVLQAQAAGQVAGSFDLLETQVLASSAASVTFSSLSTYAADYQHLQIRMTARTARTGTAGDAFSLRLNGDTGANYAAHELRGNGSTVASFAYTSQTSMLFQRITSAADTANAFGGAVVDFADAFSSTKNKTVRSLGGYSSQIFLNSGFRNNTEAITSIEVIGYSDDFVTGSRFSLYGIRAV